MNRRTQFASQTFPLVAWACQPVAKQAILMKERRMLCTRYTMYHGPPSSVPPQIHWQLRETQNYQPIHLEKTTRQNTHMFLRTLWELWWDRSFLFPCPRRRRHGHSRDIRQIYHHSRVLHQLSISSRSRTESLQYLPVISWSPFFIQCISARMYLSLATHPNTPIPIINLSIVGLSWSHKKGIDRANQLREGIMENKHWVMRLYNGVTSYLYSFSMTSHTIICCAQSLFHWLNSIEQVILNLIWNSNDKFVASDKK